MPISQQTFRLIPFPNTQRSFPMSIEGLLEFQGSHLSVCCELRGDLTRILIPPPSPPSQRLDHLWEQTCFEFFIANENLPHYWEFNLSPSHHWNVYFFTGYRQDMREEARLSEIKTRVSRIGNALILQTQIDLSDFLNFSKKVEIGIAYILRSVQGSFQYWALKHCAQEPDFHQRESFVIRI